VRDNPVAKTDNDDLYDFRKKRRTTGGFARDWSTKSAQLEQQRRAAECRAPYN